LTTINIPASVKSIGNGAFDGCTGIIQKENGISYVDKWVIGHDSGIATVSLRADAVGIGDRVFAYSSNLASITIPEGMTRIGAGAFNNCTGLTSITIPDSVTSIGSNPFAGCDKLTTLTVQSGNTAYYMSGNCLIERGSKTLITGFVNSVIPTDGSVTSIGDYAFCECDSLTTITIPARVTSIGEYAFWFCKSLTSIVIPDGMTNIGKLAFSNCDSLTSIIFEGTIAQWNSITKGTDWNYDVPATYVQCSDGQVAL
jgi:hypothetical protein